MNEPIKLHIKPTCYGCGMIAPIGCNFNPLKSELSNFTKCKGDSLVDRNVDRQFTMSLPIVTKGKNFGKPSAKQVTFNSIRCANLTLIEMFGRNAPDLGEYRASQGYQRCPTCKTVNYKLQFCNDSCRGKYEREVGIVLEVAAELKPTEYRPCKSGKKCLRAEKRKPAPTKGSSPYCGSACGASDRARAKRVLNGVNSLISQ